MPIKPVFDLRAILPVLIMFIVTAVETVGDISGAVSYTHLLHNCHLA